MDSMYLFIFLGLPMVGALVALFLKTAEQILTLIKIVTTIQLALALFIARQVLILGAVTLGDEWFLLDALATYHLVLLCLVFFTSSIYAGFYFREDIHAKTLDLFSAKRFGLLWLTSLASMILALVSNNLGIMWISIEATTLFTAFLISLHETKASLEAMWKYLMICSIGVAFAFIGTLLMCASIQDLPIDHYSMLLWTTLHQNAANLNVWLVKIGFIFLLVGYGTKAGLFPMHGWLPDAHSQSPSPVSSLFSGFLLSTALYCIMRYIPIVEKATGNSGWAHKLMIIFGIMSILAAAAFIISQQDIKRLLAYSSVEHMGIVSLGIGIGGLGVFAALFHTLNHSLAKPLNFFAAGRIGQVYGTHDMHHITGAIRQVPVWGLTLFLGSCALIGMVPFAIFMSEFQILQAAISKGAIWTAVILLLGLSIVFISVCKALLPICFGKADHKVHAEPIHTAEAVFATTILIVLIALGLFMPDFLKQAILQASQVLGGGL